MIKKSRSDDQNASHDIGYGKPPVRTRFPPGVSGNRKGRPKGTPNLKSAIRKVYTDPVVIRDGTKRHKVPRALALVRRQMDRGLIGNERAVEAAIKTGMQFGVFDEKEAEPVRKESPKYSIDLKKLSEESLNALERIMIEGAPTAGSGIDAAEEKPSDETCPKSSRK
jgi:hypothetical protein